MTTWTAVAELARLAPTPHNTQPFSLRVTSPTRAELVMDPHRLLPVGDRGLAYAQATLGIFATTLERAGEAVGRSLVTALGDDPGVRAYGTAPIVVGHARMGASGHASSPHAEQLLRHRRTSRLPYAARPATPAALTALADAARKHGHELIVESDPSRVRQLLLENAHAIIDNLQDGDERRELERWVRIAPNTPEEGDGLWATPLAQPRWEVRAGFRVPWSFKLWGLSHLAAARYIRTMGATRHVALLRGPFGHWRERIRAGRALMDLWLELSNHDLYMHPFGSTLTNPVYARRIAESFGVSDGWFIFRFGYSARPPASPRLPLSEVIR